MNKTSEAQLRANKKWNLKNREANLAYNRARHIYVKYGISIQERDAMYDAQQGLCAICGEHYDVLCVDHDHTTGRIRSLLCVHCNRNLGIVEADLSRVYDMIAYIDKHSTP